MQTFTWRDAHGQLEIGRLAPERTDVTTDHPCRDDVVGRAGFPPANTPPRFPRRGDDDDHLPGRLELALQSACIYLGSVLLAAAIVRALEARRR